jgi:hypothetical protein
MSKQLSSVARNQLEGGVFYPTGWLVAAVANQEDAQSVRHGFCASGRPDEDCSIVQAGEMRERAQAEITGQGIIAALGSSAHVRQKQLELARQGCVFVLLHAPDDATRHAALEVLSRVPVRYAVHYHSLAIEDMIKLLPSATADAETARAVASSAH